MTAPRLSVLIVFAVAAVLLQPSLGAVPTHRIARGLGSDFASKFQEYVNRYSSSSPSASSAPTETTSSSQTQTESAATSETAAGTESAASEISPSVVAKEGSSSSGGISTFQNLIPSSFSQYGQYPSHLSNQYNSNQLQNHLNPGQYISGGTTSPAASAGSAGAASEPEIAVATKEGSSSGGISSFQNLIPSSFSQYGQYPSHLSNQYNSNQLQNHLNPGQYISGGTTSPAASAGSAGAASEPEIAVATKEGSSSGGISTFQNLIPSSFSQYGQYPSHLTNQYNSNQLQNHLNPGQYISGGSTSSPSASQAS